MFDLLAITWTVSPDILSIGSFHLRWYSVLFVAGFFPLGYYIMRSFYKREGIPLESLDVLLFALMICAIVGARLGHCIAYDFKYYFTHPWKILMTWEGGLASHGGAVGVLIAMWWYVHKYGKKYGFGYIQLIDRLVIPDGMPHHPTQIYEALSYLILGLVLLWLYRTKLDKLRTGTIFGIFLIVLFGMRFLIEFIKEDQSAFEAGMALNMGQWLSVPFIIAGVLILIWSLTKAGPAAIHVPQAALSGGGRPGNNAPKKPKEKVPLSHVHSGSSSQKNQ